MPHHRDLPIDAIAARTTPGRPFLLAVSGAQGSGKSTICQTISDELERRHGLRTITLSIDDLYLTRAERLNLGRNVHPLCAHRGLPGTHDIGMGMALLDALQEAKSSTQSAIPRFDKATDDRAPRNAFDTFSGRPDIIVLEGWCVGARPGPAWAGPINDRERQDDPDGVWHRWSEGALAGVYQQLWQRFDALLFINSPSFETVLAGRCHQEARLAERIAAAGGQRPVGLMTEAEVIAYVALFERKTRQMLEEMPRIADWVIPHWMQRESGAA